MTFSVVARSSGQGQFAVAVSSSSPSVAARCAYARANVGAVTTQNITDPRLGPWALDLMEKGATATQALDIIINSCDHPAYRQMTIIDKHGNTAVFSGSQALGVSATATGKDIACAGNLLATDSVPQAMADHFEASDPSLELGARVIAAMQAGIAAGGEAGPVHSAGLVVVSTEAWPLADLRVDWDQDQSPVTKLAELWSIWQPQMYDYVTRCLNPSAAPSYGVPGDE